jgi:LysR family cyn operon transcriptional activator
LLDLSFAKAGVKPKVAMELNATEAILEIVMQSELATIMSVRRPSARRGIRCIELQPPITRRAAIFWRKRSHRPKAAAALADLIKKAYAEERSRGP